jgi:hypothetical protein
MAAVLCADVVSHHDVNVSALDGYDLIGFGSGIAFGKHYKGLLKWVDGLPILHKKAFVFSTRGDRRLRFPPCVEGPIRGERVDYRRRVLLSRV